MFNFWRRPLHGRMAVRDRFADIRKKVQTDSPIIVDGGAHKGQMTSLFLRQYSSPTIHAFEPIPDLVDELKFKFGSNEKVKIYDQALGAEEKKASFKVLKYIGSSSILNPTELNHHYHPSMMETKRTIDVQQVRLDNTLDSEIDILKLDLQGYELEALKGSEKLLSRIKIITTEIEFVSLYEAQPLFGEIDIFLRENGFDLFNLYELFTHPDGQLTAGDAVYLNTKYFKRKEKH